MNVMDIVYFCTYRSSWRSTRDNSDRTHLVTIMNRNSKKQQQHRTLGDDTREEIVEDSKKEAMLAVMTESVMADELLDELMVWHIQRMAPVLVRGGRLDLGPVQHWRMLHCDPDVLCSERESSTHGRGGQLGEESHLCVPGTGAER